MSKSDVATKQDMAGLRTEIKQDMREMFDDVLGVIDVLTTRMDERFTKLEAAFAKQQEDIRQILVRLDHIDKRLEIDEQERLVMGHQLEQLDKWVHELAGKIGYKLSA